MTIRSTRAGLVRAILPSAELRAEPTDPGDAARVLTGYAAIFNARADLGYFTEEVLPGAFARSLAEDDQVALWNHESGHPLGRVSRGTLALSEDARGLKMRLELPDTQAGRDVYHLVERGDVAGMSFGFQIRAEEAEDLDSEKPHFKIQDVRLFEVSPVTFPAYPQTEIAARARDRLEAARARIAPDPAAALAAEQARAWRLRLADARAR
jgi:HK97 family phage prohead protease